MQFPALVGLAQNLQKRACARAYRWRAASNTTRKRAVTDDEPAAVRDMGLNPGPIGEFNGYATARASFIHAPGSVTCRKGHLKTNV